MAHLANYENAKEPLEKTLAALVVVENKNSRRLAWEWAETAAEHAEEAGVLNAGSLLGNGRWPKVETLRKVLKAL